MTLVTPEATSLDDLASTVRAEYARGQAAHAAAAVLLPATIVALAYLAVWSEERDQ